MNKVERLVKQGLTPMMQQYFRIKERHKDHIVFFRLGDFYEMFFEDAEEVSRVLGLTLTGRDCGLAERAPMCGVPHHSSETYVARLVKAGYKVAICEQTEDPAFAKGVVSRDVVRVITPGTLMEDGLLEEDSNNFLCSIYYGEEGYGLAFADISTGQVEMMELESDDEGAVMNALARYAPREVIFNPAFVDKAQIARFMRERLVCTADMLEDECCRLGTARQEVLAHFGREQFSDLGLEGRPRSICALGGLLSYLRETQKVGLERLCTVVIKQEGRTMQMDENCRTGLELLTTIRSKEKRGSLLWVLDKTKTPMGKRLMRNWITQPLTGPAEIEKRLNAVEELWGDELLLEQVGETLGNIFDLERLITRVVYGNATPREVLTLGRTLTNLPPVRQALEPVKSNFLCTIREEIDPLEDISGLIASAIVEEPPVNLKEGGVIQSEFHPQLAELRELMGSAKERLSAMEGAEREATGIKNLKIRYNKVFGYYIEVSRSGLSQVPEHYIRKQTIANGERYITQELKELENRILSAHDQAIALESELFEQVRVTIARELHRIQASASAVARLDVFCSFARVSLDNRYVRPEISTGDQIIIREGRHPVVEQMLDGLPFVPNDVTLDCGENQISIITGPNMAGKSTYMRQTALIVLMAQIGCFVPAASATIGIVDGIYTRIGASDDLSTGKSTFMVEMVELATILKNATSKSLLILDEIGRGTSTYDGMSIARSVLEYIAQPRKLGARTMFATHYHELTELEETLSRVKNYNVAVKKRGDDITFLRKIVRGGADDSYGIEVSKLAGIPDTIVKRAHEILTDLESAQPVREGKGLPVVREEDEMQLSLGSRVVSEVEEELKRLDLDTLTPIEALTKLFELRKLLN